MYQAESPPLQPRPAKQGLVDHEAASKFQFASSEGVGFPLSPAAFWTKRTCTYCFRLPTIAVIMLCLRK